MKRLAGVFVLLAFISAAIFWLASLDITHWAGAAEKRGLAVPAEKRVQDAQGSMLLGPGSDVLRSISRRYQDISVKSVPSIVHVRSIPGDHEQSVILENDAISDYYEQLGIDAENEGTGVFVNDQGLILTPLHLVLGAVAIQVRTWDGKIYQAELVSADAGTDLAVLKIPSSGTRAIQWGDSSSIGLGEYLVLVGADPQMNGRICQGVVSSSPRLPQVLDEGYFGNYFLVDASSSSPGSGWLVLNLEGKVVGILGQGNARIYGSGGECVALASSQVRQVVDLLAQGSVIRRSFVGIHLQQMTPDLAEALGTKQASGALVSDVVPGSPAEHAGMLPGDLILKIASQPISQYGQVRVLVADLPPDKEVAFQIERQGAARTLQIVPVRHPMQVIATRNSTVLMRGASAAAETSLLDGIGVEELPGAPRMAGQPKRMAIQMIDYQQVVPSIPLESGVLLLEVDGEKLSGRADFERLREKVKGKPVVGLRIESLGKRRYLTLRSAY